VPQRGRAWQRRAGLARGRGAGWRRVWWRVGMRRGGRRAGRLRGRSFGPGRAGQRRGRAGRGGRGGGGLGSGAGAGAAGWAAAGWAAGAGWPARWTSSFRMRPPRPVPLTESRSTPLRAASARAEGMAAAGICDLSALAAGCAGAGFAGAGLSEGAGLAGSLAAVSTSPMTSPTRTVAPLAAPWLVRMPATGEGTSTVTLSVSSSTRGWSTSTRAPTGCSQLAMMASVMDSPRAGTLIELGMGTRSRGRCQARLAKASSRMSLRSSAWLSGEPVAGEAEATRPT
jgi:hypothetical protein